MNRSFFCIHISTHMNTCHYHIHSLMRNGLKGEYIYTSTKRKKKIFIITRVAHLKYVLNDRRKKLITMTALIYEGKKGSLTTGEYLTNHCDS